MAINYYNTHLTKKESSVIIPKHALEKGMIIQARYTNVDRKSKQYMFVVLNRDFRGKVHLLSLNEMTTYQLNDMARRTGIRIIPNFKKRGLDFEKLLIMESSNRFYHRKLAGNMDTMYNHSYRTFFANKLGLVQLIDYRFDKDIEPPKDNTLKG
mgnify:FL=1